MIRPHSPALGLFLTAVLSWSGLPTESFADDVVDVVFVGGQSNAKSQLVNGVRSVLEGSDALTNVRVVNKRHGGTPIRYWLDPRVPRASKHHPRKHKFRAENYYQVDFHRTADQPGPTAFLDLVYRKVREADQTPRLAGLVWFQGESDTNHDKYVKAYRSRLKELRRRLSDDFNDGRPVPTVLVRIAATPDGVEEAFGEKDPERKRRIEEIADIQTSLADDEPLVAVVDSEPYERIDIWHVDWQTEPISPLEKVGEECGKALLGLIEE